MGFIKSIVVSIVWVIVIFFGITFWTDYYYPGKFSEYEFVAPAALEGDLGLNKRLDSGEALLRDQIFAPESLALHNGEIYTGLHTSEIVKITKDLQLDVVFNSAQYDEKRKVSVKGRPLSLKFDKKGLLYATDIVFGIFKIDLKTKKAELVVDIREKIEGDRASMANSLDVADNGDIYWSDSCIGTFPPEFLSNPCGRLIRYNAKTKRNEVLVRNLSMANGVALSRDESFVLVSESTASRIVKYHLTGAKAGQSEIFIEGLPGFPDNINLDNKDGFLVGVPAYFDAEHLPYLHYLAPRPLLRKFIVGMIFMLRTPFDYLHRFYPIFDPTPIVTAINLQFIDAPINAVLRLDKNGKIIDAAYCTNGLISGISTAQIVGDDLWIGSYKAPLIARIPLKQALPTLAKK